MTIFDITAFILSCHYGVLGDDGKVKKVDESYRSLTPQEFEKVGYGVCHDFANWVTYQLALNGFCPVGTEPKEGECAVLYIQFSFKGTREHNTVHAMPIFAMDGKLHVIEGTWQHEGALGHKEFYNLRNLEFEMVELIEDTLTTWSVRQKSSIGSLCPSGRVG